MAEFFAVEVRLTMVVAKKALLVLLLGVCCCLAFTGPAQAELSNNQAEINADTIDYDDTRGEVRLLGNVVVKYDGAVITSSYARYLVKKQEADFQGNVKAVYKDTVLTGSQLSAVFQRHLVQMRGKARLETNRPLGTAQPQTTVLTADAIGYDWQKQLATAKGQVQVEQGDRRAFADLAEYREREHSVTLRGNVRFERGKNEWLMSESVVIDLSMKKVVASGRVAGRFAFTSTSKQETKPTAAEPKEDIIETTPQTETVEDVSPLLLPGLREDQDIKK